MHVVRHQHLSVQCAFRFSQRLAQPVQVAAVVILGEEARLAVMTALHDVQGNAIQVNAATAGHVAGYRLSSIIPSTRHLQLRWTDLLANSSLAPFSTRPLQNGINCRHTNFPLSGKRQAKQLLLGTA